MSQRADAQKVAVPNVNDPEATQRGVGLQQGDRQMLEAAMGSVPLAGSAPIDVSRPGGGGGGAPPSAAGRPGELPAWLFDMDSARPEEPVTAGLPMGEGAGPEALQTMPAPEDDAEAVLAFLAETMGDRAAADMLREMQAARAAAVPASIPSGPPTSMPVDSAPASGDEIMAEEIDLPEEVPESGTEEALPPEEGGAEGTPLPPEGAAVAPVEPGEGGTAPAPAPETTE